MVKHHNHNNHNNNHPNPLRFHKSLTNESNEMLSNLARRAIPSIRCHNHNICHNRYQKPQSRDIFLFGTLGSTSTMEKRYAHTVGYQAMGSFHSENVDVLMSLDDDEYIPPVLPFDPTHHHGLSKDDARTGTSDDDDFLLDRTTWTFLNHGAFGAALRVGHDRAEQWRLYLERQPLRYFDRDLLPNLVYSARRLCQFCNASRDALTLIPNVTFGLNTIVRGYTQTYKDGAHIILWDTSYGSLKKIARQHCDNVTEIAVSDYFPLMEEMEEPGDIFEQALLNVLDNDDVATENALLILDHTTSNTALNMPLESLSELAKSRNMLVMVDGAHGLLAQTVSLDTFPNIDFYVANCHKWVACPRGIGFLYCPHPHLRDTVLRQPAVISHGIDDGYHSRFLWDGCRDYSAALSVPAVLDYWQEKGIDTVQAQIRAKLHSAVHLLATAWHNNTDDSSPPSSSCTLAPLSLHSPMMALVKLPDSVQLDPSTSDDAKAVQDYLHDQKIEVPIKCIRGILYVRISSHVYNDLSEYERLAAAILEKQER